MPAMNTPRKDFGISVLNGKLYAVGGLNGTLCLNTAERFDPIAGKWEFIPNMDTKRTGHSVVSSGDFLYALGGWDNTYIYASVEKYDPNTDRWMEANQMALHCRYFGAASLVCPDPGKVIFPI